MQSSGYVRNKTYVLTFDDPEFEGLEVRAKGASAGQVLGLMDLMRLAGAKEFTADNRRDLERLFRTFAGCPPLCAWPHEDQGGNHYVSRIKSWNLRDEDDGCAVDVPPTYEGLMAQDLEFVTSLVFAWLNGIVGTPGELGKASNGGGPSVEGSIPMETLSSVPLS